MRAGQRDATKAGGDHDDAELTEVASNIEQPEEAAVEADVSTQSEVRCSSSEDIFSRSSTPDLVELDAQRLNVHPCVTGRFCQIR